MLHQDISGVFQSNVGVRGLHKIDLERAFLQASRAAETISSRFESGDYPFLDCVREEKDISLLRPLVQALSQNETILVLGTGGSSLGGQTLTALRDGGVGFHFKKPDLYFLDNIDPFSMRELLDHINLNKTGIVVISKSGTTPETLAQILVCEKVWKDRDLSSLFSKNTLVVTEEKSSPLYRFSKEHGLICLAHDPKVGGRFSVFSLVGLIPLMITGLDPLKLRNGGATVLENCLQHPNSESLPVMGASVIYGLMTEKSIHQTVLMPYVDRLAPFGLWFRQLWAESLGKNGIGLTPIRAMGTVDQHSQLQLYLEGPKDKFYTILGMKNFEKERETFSLDSSDPDISFFGQKYMSDLLKAEEKATVSSLIQHGCPTRQISFNTLDEEVLGALLMQFMLETLLMGEMLKIDPLTQPAVESIKVLTKKYLS